jgi:Zn ribbon nucleic-acid-binding protein
MNAAIIFCMKCRSEKVDIRFWHTANVCEIACCACGHTSAVSGFTLGRFGYTDKAPLDEAREDAVFEPRMPKEPVH